MHTIIDGWSWSTLWLLYGPIRQLDRNQLKLLMGSSLLNEHNATLFADPLLQLLAPGNNFYHFFSLPKRRSHFVYGEVMLWFHY